jgi:hypothetical protein
MGSTPARQSSRSEFFIFFVSWTRRPDQMYEDIARLAYEDEPEKLRAQRRRGKAKKIQQIRDGDDVG